VSSATSGNGKATTWKQNAEIIRKWQPFKQSFQILMTSIWTDDVLFATANDTTSCPRISESFQGQEHVETNPFPVWKGPPPSLMTRAVKNVRLSSAGSIMNLRNRVTFNFCNDHEARQDTISTCRYRYDSSTRLLFVALKVGFSGHRARNNFRIQS
jgi:1,4-alpha-glucan branching enzyme